MTGADGHPSPDFFRPRRGDYCAVFGAEGAQLFIEPGVALCPGGAGEFVAFCGGAEE
jgi:hypothetical protein